MKLTRDKVLVDRYNKTRMAFRQLGSQPVRYPVPPTFKRASHDITLHIRPTSTGSYLSLEKGINQ